MLELMNADKVTVVTNFTIGSKIEALTAYLTYGNNRYMYGEVTYKKGELKKTLCTLLWVPPFPQNLDIVGARLMEVLNSDADWLVKKYG